MKRSEQIKAISQDDKIWDVIVVGGGATGLGCAVDATARGYSVALLEKDDFAKATSSRSTKLVHGGVRYLQHGDVKLVLEALRERGFMKRNAPHLVKDQAFVISNYSHWENFLYFCGLTLYDMLSFGFGYGRSRFIGPKTVEKYLPTIEKKGLKGGVVYHDGQFDDARMAVNLAQTVVDHGGTVVNHAKVVALLHDDNGKVCGVTVVDEETGQRYDMRARAVINAAGIFVDDVMLMDEPEKRRMVRPSQGVHIVLDKKFLQSDYAMMVPKTSDGRVLFAVPWHDRVIVGTTDVPRDKPESEPHYLEQEVDFILRTAGLYMRPAPTRADIKAVFAGQRPLAAPEKDGQKTKEISRSHKIMVSGNGLITITGGKWTSYRLMAEDTIDRAIDMGLLDKRKCVTRSYPIHGYKPNPDERPPLCVRQRPRGRRRAGQARAGPGREAVEQVRLHDGRGGLGGDPGDGTHGRRCAGPPRASALHRCPRGRRCSAQGCCPHGPHDGQGQGVGRAASRRLQADRCQLCVTSPLAA